MNMFGSMYFWKFTSLLSVAVSLNKYLEDSEDLEISLAAEEEEEVVVDRSGERISPFRYFGWVAYGMVY